MHFFFFFDKTRYSGCPMKNFTCDEKNKQIKTNIQIIQNKINKVIVFYKKLNLIEMKKQSIIFSPILLNRSKLFVEKKKKEKKQNL